MTDEIDRNAQSEERDDDRGYTYYDIDTRKFLETVSQYLKDDDQQRKF